MTSLLERAPKKDHSVNKKALVALHFGFTSLPKCVMHYAFKHHSVLINAGCSGRLYGFCVVSFEISVFGVLFPIFYDVY